MSTASTPEHAQLAAALAEGLTQIEAANTPDLLRTAMSVITGKKGALATVKSSLGKMTDVEARKVLGQEVNLAFGAIGTAGLARERALVAAQLAEKIETERVDVTELAMTARTTHRRGRLHLVTQATERLEDVFIGL
jgi:phenylalanyl-tRNA synthetase alpha chain